MIGSRKRESAQAQEASGFQRIAGNELLQVATGSARRRLCSPLPNGVGMAVQEETSELACGPCGDDAEGCVGQSNPHLGLFLSFAVPVIRFWSYFGTSEEAASAHRATECEKGE